MEARESPRGKVGEKTAGPPADDAREDRHRASLRMEGGAAGGLATLLHPRPSTGGSYERIGEVCGLHRGIPDGCPNNAASAGALHHDVAIPVPPHGGAGGCLLVLQVLVQEQPNAELAEVGLVQLACTAWRWERHHARLIARRLEERIGVENLLGGRRKVGEDVGLAALLLVPLHEVRAGEVWKEERLLNDHRRRGEDGHGALVLTDHLANAVAAAHA